ncbi:uncharacterized protein LOC110427410 [Herrania umbratica]|uniref:Uncharacterized protein LOC110427410 n=1 Tax=Herrania umbratica TaxID=108875 RepID=A0A6J1BH26_9ROSI|nr:uncharacterized protein LOC110427410 [Herrania umbratica]
MFDLLMKPKFYAKCKSDIRMIKMRLETIKKKRNAVEKYLKNDIAELLRSGLDYNGYGRAEGLLIEQNRTACYNLIEQFSECISKHVSVMQKSSECPEECKEAIPSLIYAAARFADLPELRDLRTIFTERYGNSLESFLNQEFVWKLKAEPPTKEMKLQLMHDVAQEFSIEWDSKALEQKLFKPPPPQQNEAWHKSLDDADDNGHKLYRSKNDTFQKSNNHDDEIGLGNMLENTRPKRNETGLTSHGRKEDTDNKYKLHSSSEDELSDKVFPNTGSTSVESVSEDNIENRKPFYYRFMPPPYVRPSLGKEKSSTEEPTTPSDNTDNEKNSKWDDSVGESKPKPRSVRRRPLKPPPGREVLSSDENDGAAKNLSSSAVNLKEARKGLASIQIEESDERDNEEKMMDGLLMHYSKKKSPYELASKWKANLRLAPGRQTAEDSSKGSRFRSTKSDPSSPPGRAATFPKEATSPTETTGRHARASSLQPDMFAGHVHPKLPEYDDLAARLAALRGG